jgi:DNA gyrase subunit A
MLFSRSGQAIRFAEGLIRASSRNSGGMRGMRLDAEDELVGAAVAELGAEVLIVSERGYAKRTDLTEFPTTGRGGGGVRAMSIVDKNGPVVTVRTVRPEDEVMVISAEGQVLRTAVEGISKVGRAAKGVILLNLDPPDRVAAIAVLRPSEVRPEADGHANGKVTRSRGVKQE